MKNEVYELEELTRLDHSKIRVLNITKDRLIQLQDMEEIYWRQKSLSLLKLFLKLVSIDLCYFIELSLIIKLDISKADLSLTMFFLHRISFMI